MGRSSKCFKCSSWGHFCPCPQLKPQQLQINFLRPFMTKMPFKRLCIWGTPLGSFECLKRDSCGHFCTCPQPKPQQLKMDFLRRFMTKTPSKYDTPLQHVRRILVWGTPLGSFVGHFVSRFLLWFVCSRCLLSFIFLASVFSSWGSVQCTLDIYIYILYIYYIYIYI